MKRKDYMKPAIRVVFIQYKCHLLAESGVRSMRSGYGEAKEEEWN